MARCQDYEAVQRDNAGLVRAACVSRVCVSARATDEEMESLREIEAMNPDWRDLYDEVAS
jgi:hypothetical protein